MFKDAFPFIYFDITLQINCSIFKWKYKIIHLAQNFLFLRPHFNFHKQEDVV